MSEGVLTVLGMMAVGLIAWASTRGNPGTSTDLIDQLQKRIEHLEDRLRDVEAELDDEKIRTHVLEASARRRESVPADALPMRQFVEDGWFRRYVQGDRDEHGVIVGVYVNDYDGESLDGYQVKPIETATLDQLITPEQDRVFRERVAAAAAKARADAGFPPWTPTKETP